MMIAARVRHTLLPAVLCGLAFVPRPATAAEILTGSGTQVDCAATLSGEIASGDLGRIRELGIAPFRSGGRPLCLDSEGGSVAEALRIADYLQDWAIPTALDAGARCVGPCALAFLGGTSARPGSAPGPDRRLHAEAVLGLGPVTDAGQQVMARKSSLGLPDEMAQDMLSLPDGEVLRIDTVGKARALNIALAGAGSAPSTLGDDMVRGACIAQKRGFDPSLSTTAQPVYEHKIQRERDDTTESAATFIVEAVVDGFPSWIGCQVELVDDTAGDPLVRLRHSDDWTQGANPSLRDIHIDLLPKAWKRIPAGDMWTLLPDDAPLSAALTPAQGGTEDSELVDPVGPMPETTLGTEEKLGLRSADRREIQRRLNLLDFDTLGVDGIFGPGSRKAITAWQKARGHEPTGFLDGEQVAELKQASESLYRDWQAEQDRLEAMKDDPAPVQRRSAPSSNRSPSRSSSPSSSRSPAPSPEPRGQRVRVCQRTIFGELVNCRIEYR